MFMCLFFSFGTIPKHLFGLPLGLRQNRKDVLRIAWIGREGRFFLIVTDVTLRFSGMMVFSQDIF